MKKLSFLLSIILLSGCCNFCIPQEAKTNAANNAKLTDAFVVLMDEGKTTRNHEQEYIKASRRAWHAQNKALNDEPLPPDIEKWFQENANINDTE